MKHSVDRILTTHAGSLPRPRDLLDMMKAQAAGGPFDAEAFARRVREAVAESVRRQVECGIDIVTDGEQSKTGFSAYVRQRLAGFEPRPEARRSAFAAEVEAFPEYYEQYFSRAMTGGSLVPAVPMVCTGPVSYIGREALARDIDNLTAALAALNVAPAEVFMPAVAPSGVGSNEYYSSGGEYMHAVAEAMRTEYQAIVDAGFILQIDDPFLTEHFSYSLRDHAERRKTAAMYVEALNHGLRGIPSEKVRYHTCYGINEGPRVYDAPLRDIVDVMLKVNASAFSFEAANARHEHEYHVWEDVKLRDGTILIPGVITHASNIVEHPELIAERIARYARLVGRENVIAGADCGFSSQATYTPEVHPTVIWAKFQALAEGARLATRQLWR
jgi:5-methyltetrahydropteroyltriglutamate--homocysteine methyltransferase